MRRAEFAVRLALVVSGAVLPLLLPACAPEEDAARPAPSQEVAETHRKPRARAGKPAGAKAEAETALPGLEAGGGWPEVNKWRSAKREDGRTRPDGSRIFGDGENGPWRQEDANGNVVLQGTFKWGRRDGLWTEYHTGGGRTETEYRDGKLHGREAAWSKDGTPRFLGRYEDGEMAGTWNTWHDDGTLLMTREYTAGRLHGTLREFHRNGTVARESVYAQGKDAGPTTTWHEDGSLECVMPHTDGKRQGEAVWYHRNGRVAARGTYVDDRLDGTYRTWDEDGTERPAEEWRKGIRVSGPRLRASAALGGEPLRGDGTEER
jgi:antitoxin component YwqK of YwqJK toxin-antitoxin module